jgi:cytochrome d ubiquinol oxidase subunit I
VHLSFQLMVGLGSVMALVGGAALAAGFVAARRRGQGRWAVPEARWLLAALAWTAPAGILAVETGWMVTELGRQPWIVQG